MKGLALKTDQQPVVFCSTTDTGKPSYLPPLVLIIGRIGLTRIREWKFRVGQVWPSSLLKFAICLNVSYQGGIEPECTYEKRPGPNTPSLRSSGHLHWSLGLSWRLSCSLCLQCHPLLSWLLNLARVSFQRQTEGCSWGLQSYLCFPGVSCTLWSRAAECVALQLSEQQCECPSCRGLPWLHTSIGFFSLHVFLRCLSEYPQAGLSYISSDPRVPCRLTSCDQFLLGSRLCPSGLCDSPATSRCIFSTWMSRKDYWIVIYSLCFWLEPARM